MDNYIIIISLVVACLALLAVLVMYFCYSRMERERDHSVMQQILERDRVAKEMERIRVAKGVLEELVKEKISHSHQASYPKNENKNNLEY